MATNMTANNTTGGDIVLCGYLRKLKTMKKKYFVLRSSGSIDSSARLEYYDSEKKYKARSPPKRAILLRRCLNIEKRCDTKHKSVIALHMKDDCFSVVFDSETNLRRWLNVLQRQMCDGNEKKIPESAEDDASCAQDNPKSFFSSNEIDNCKPYHISLSPSFSTQSDARTKATLSENAYENWNKNSISDIDSINNRISGIRLSSSESSPKSTSCSTYTSLSDRLVEDNSYVPMSPGTTGSGSPPKNWHSRTSSIAEGVAVDFHSVGSWANSAISCVDMQSDSGYVPMSGNGGGDFLYVPITTNTSLDYVDMEPDRSTSRTSITSGTPSTDLRFSEYHLEKVQSYFAPSSDDEDSTMSRPIRAYSVGSRPEYVNRKNHLHALNKEQMSNNQCNASRIRAFSVGSRTKLQQQQSARQSHDHTQHHQPNGHIMNHGTVHNQHNRKANSAPLLSTSWGERTGRSLYGTVEPLGDLMEIDFSRNNGSSINIHTSNSSISGKRHHLKDEGYVDMTSNKSNTNGYVEMRPLISSSPPKGISIDVLDGYVDMTPGSTSISSTILSSTRIPLRQRNTNLPSTSPLRPNCISSPRGSSLSQKVKQLAGRQNQQQDYLTICSNLRQEARSQPIDLPRTRTQATTDGYVEMSWNESRNNTNQLSSSADNYTNMSFENVYKKYQKNLKNYETASAYLPQSTNMMTSQRKNSRDEENGTSSGSPLKCILNKSYQQQKCLSHASSAFSSDEYADQVESHTVAEIEESQCIAKNHGTTNKEPDYVNCKPPRRISPSAGDYVLLLTSA